MACDFCGDTFNSYQPLLVTIERSGSDVLLYVGNQSKNIISITRMLLCLRSQSSTTILYLRSDYPIQTLNRRDIESYMSSVLEYQLTSSADSAQAEAEYVEIDGRSVSCSYDL